MSQRFLAPLGRRSDRRQAFTLVEMLVALVITLILMGAATTIFGIVANSVSESRAVMEASDRLRSARSRLQLDLGGITATMQPPLRPETGAGFFEYIEGPTRDWRPFFPVPTAPLPNPDWTTMLGDSDDILCMTVRSLGDPFVGTFFQKRAVASGETRDDSDSTGDFKWQPVGIESKVAEIVWFMSANGPRIADYAGNTV